MAMTNKEFKVFCKRVLPLVKEMMQVQKDMGIDHLMSVDFSSDGYIRLEDCEDGAIASMVNASGTDHPVITYTEGLFEDDV